MNKPTPRQPILDIYTCLQNRHRDLLAQKLSRSDRAFVRAQMYMRTPRTREVSLGKCVFLFLIVLMWTISGGVATYFFLRFLTSLPK